MKINGVLDVYEIDEGVAVVWKNTWAVIKGQRALEPKWEHGDFLSWDSARIKNMMEEKSTGKAVIAREDGD